MPKLYKFLHDMQGEEDRQTWVTGKWRHANGYYASEYIQQALASAAGNVLAEVTVEGEPISDGGKSYWRKMCVVKTWPWDRRMNVKLAIYAAELVLPVFEQLHPVDQRPREAIVAAKTMLDSEGTLPAAAHAAAAAAAAGTAAHLAGSVDAAHVAHADYITYAAAAHAAYAAAAAAHAAYAATSAYTTAGEYAAFAANSAASAAAYDAAAQPAAAMRENVVWQRIHEYALSLVKESARVLP